MLILKPSDTNLVVCVLVCFQHSISELRYELNCIFSPTIEVIFARRSSAMLVQVHVRARAGTV